MSDWSIGQCATLACLIEATAPKPGNVHRGADFADLSYPDFVVAGALLGRVFDEAPRRRLGNLVLDAVATMRSAVATNTHLGTILLLAPLAKVLPGQRWAEGVARVLAELDADDAQRVYQAIRQAGAGGLGRVPEHDLADEPPADLLRAMRAAAPRDLVARQYAENFRPVLHEVVPRLASALDRGWTLADAVVRVHLEVLAAFPDSLIARKCGQALAVEAGVRAAAALAAGEPGQEDYHRALGDFDFWLRSDHHRRNPGTTADLLAAGLFVALREGIVRAPFRLAEFSEP